MKEQCILCGSERTGAYNVYDNRIGTFNICFKGLKNDP